MAGCFGNHPVDKYLEGQLMQHLREEEDSEDRCYDCGWPTSEYCEYCDDPCCENHNRENSKGMIVCLECYNEDESKR